jgi:molybdopterin molybdotransferase
MTDLLSFDEARSRILADVPRVGTERVALLEAAGRVLAEDLVAHEPLPRFDHSAMDGYAIATSDLRGDGPWELEVAGESSAGPRLRGSRRARRAASSPARRSPSAPTRW